MGPVLTSSSPDPLPPPLLLLLFWFSFSFRTLIMTVEPSENIRSRRSFLLVDAEVCPWCYSESKVEEETVEEVLQEVHCEEENVGNVLNFRLLFTCVANCDR